MIECVNKTNEAILNRYIKQFVEGISPIWADEPLDVDNVQGIVEEVSRTD